MSISIQYIYRIALSYLLNKMVFNSRAQILNKWPQNWMFSDPQLQHMRQDTEMLIRNCVPDCTFYTINGICFLQIGYFQAALYALVFKLKKAQKAFHLNVLESFHSLANKTHLMAS